jgi:hypothetical protein
LEVRKRAYNFSDIEYSVSVEVPHGLSIRYAPTDGGKAALKRSVAVAEINFNAEIVSYRHVKLAVAVEVSSYYLEST